MPVVPVSFVSSRSSVPQEKLPAELLASWAALYCRIWREPPWCEDFWKEDAVAAMLLENLEKPDAAAFLAVIGGEACGEAVGFTLGYSVCRDGLRAVAGSDLLDSLFVKADRVYYVAELGIASSHRGRRISFGLTSRLIRHASDQGLRFVTLRTDVEAAAARHLYQKLGFEELSVRGARHPSRTYWLLSL